MNAREFVRKVAINGDRTVILEYAETTATFYVRRITRFDSTVATDVVVETLRRNGVRIIGVPIMPPTRFPVFCAVCDNIVGASTIAGGPVLACVDCAAAMFDMSAKEFAKYNPQWLVDAIEDAKRYVGC